MLKIAADIESALKKAGVRNARQESRWILSALTGLAPAEIPLHSKYVLSYEQMAQSQGMLEKRCSGMPLSRVLGAQNFMGLEFKLNRDTLDPRIDTEILVEQVLKDSAAETEATLLDLGTGSGCIALAILSSRPNFKGLGVDKSEAALKQAGANARHHGLEDRFALLCADWSSCLSGKFDYIVSNPPYIRHRDITNLDTEVRKYDPILALDGGNDGLESIRQIIFSLKNLLSKAGKAFLEIGYDQRDEVARLIEKSGFQLYDVHPDSTGIPRVVEISNGDK